MATRPEIRNIVATCTLGCSLNLEHIEDNVPLTLHTPKLFFGLILCVLHPYKADCHLYRNGKMTVNGGCTLRSSKSLARRFCSLLRDIGYQDAQVTDYKVVNMVACCNYAGKPTS
ncbi:hypothetical protein RvY_12335 [Ramazzottius varieornatus]|uniref:Uncharacterized protein n=1 Tax=Ramazzottius varieornatus TaxID=947166 RepID=A0A1D1VJ55_RAMVA|nr:hypothetical protein RvY_12335 [Ramazzottius varieornatus]